MNNDERTNAEIEGDDFQVEDDSESMNILSSYSLPKEEMIIADRFAGLINNIANNSQYDRFHLAAILKYTSNKIFETREDMGDQKEELENQKSDLEHKLSFTQPDSVEYNETLRAIGDIIMKRRAKKDMWTILSVISTNISRSGNFILGMDKRLYTPRSNKYKVDGCMSNDNDKKNNLTTIKFNNVKK